MIKEHFSTRSHWFRSYCRSSFSYRSHHQQKMIHWLRRLLAKARNSMSYRKKTTKWKETKPWDKFLSREATFNERSEQLRSFWQLFLSAALAQTFFTLRPEPATWVGSLGKVLDCSKFQSGKLSPARNYIASCSSVLGEATALVVLLGMAIVKQFHFSRILLVGCFICCFDIFVDVLLCKCREKQQHTFFKLILFSSTYSTSQ